MKFFADTAEIDEIRKLADTGLLDGVTTNPSLVKKSGRDFIEVVKEICLICPGPVSAEVVALDHAGMMKEAETLRKIADNIAVKVPLTIDGLMTCKALTSDGLVVTPSSSPVSYNSLISAVSAVSTKNFMGVSSLRFGGNLPVSSRWAH
jgi:transaldolase